MIVISEASRDDNFLSVSQESTKTAAYKGSLTLLSTLNKRFDHQSRTALNALIMGDAYQEKRLRIILYFSNKFPGTGLKISISFPLN